MANYNIHIKCLAPFNNWEEDIPCNPRPQDICKIMRIMARQNPQCNIELQRDSKAIAYAKWSNKRQVHDLGVEPEYNYVMAEAQ